LAGVSCDFQADRTQGCFRSALTFVWSVGIAQGEFDITKRGDRCKRLKDWNTKPILRLRILAN